MKFLVISDAHHLKQEGKWVAYSPYVKEMDLWFSKVDAVQIIAPTRYKQKLLAQSFQRQDIEITSLRRLEFHTFKSAIVSAITLPYQFAVLCYAFAKTEHIHLRCPGNLGLLACIAQIFFPNKKKTVKYAGNWDPNSNQPLAYRIQRHILSNTRLSKNIQVLVYGEWHNQTKNIKSFFTASYSELEKRPVVKRDYTNQLTALFVGTLSDNKRPIEVLKIIQALRELKINIRLELFGEGPLKEDIEQYIMDNRMQDAVLVHGNQPLAVLTDAYKTAHFAFLLSRSEGWPKAIAEPMFWGCIPIATPVSCVPWMLGELSNEQTGILINDINKAAQIISQKILEKNQLESMSQNAKNWSQAYTLDKFEKEIEKLL